jgi:hypothetical protein
LQGIIVNDANPKTCSNWRSWKRYAPRGWDSCEECLMERVGWKWRSSSCAVCENWTCG